MAWVYGLRVCLLALLCLGNVAIARAQDEPVFASSATSDENYAPLIDSLEAKYLRSTADLTRYEVTAELEPASADALARIVGRATIAYRNHTGAPLRALYLRLYPNAAEYDAGEMTVSRLQVDDANIRGTLGQDDTLLTIPLPEPVAKDATVEVAFRFKTVIPTDPRNSYGMFKYDTDTNTYALAHWLPLLAGWDAEHGWNTGPISINGDPVFTEAAVFSVELTAPAELVVATSGSLIDQETIGNATKRHIASGPSRDFVIAASPDFEIQERTVGETTVRSYALPDSRPGATLVLEKGAQALETYNDLIGQYPYEELDLVEVDIGNGAGGVEFSGLVYVGSAFYDSDEIGTDRPGFLEFIVVHEVAHQWFYGVVGNNQYQHAFMDESLANYLSIVYYAAAYGADEANRQANLQLRLGYFNVLFDEGDQIIDQPTDDFPSMRAYGEIIYGKGALAFLELRREIGTEAFFGALQHYYEDFAFLVAEPDDLKAAFETASGQNLDAFWRHWFEEPAGEDDFDATDLARLLRELDE